MGVPGFFLWFIKVNDNEEIIIKKIRITHKFDYLLLDANSLIHPVCMKVISEYQKENIIFDNDKLEDIMIKSIIQNIIQLIEFISPNIATYIAIDGVAPMAKIKQQRMRRFKSIHDKILINNIKKKYNEPIDFTWNNNAITPGTTFMVKLHNYILEWIKTTQYKIIYSSCFSPSEGEHKLLQFIKNNNNNKHVIYGLDADLIFLSLSSNVDNIHLLREVQEFDKKKEKDLLIENNYNFVNMDKFKKLIIKIIKNNINKYSNSININNLNNNNLINDFIFICYFLGNDFLPHIYALDIYHNGIEQLIINYSKALNNILFTNNNINYLIENNYYINQQFLIEFIQNLSLTEEQTLQYNYYHQKKNINIQGSPYQREIMKIENLLFKINDPIKLGSDSYNEYRLRYYNYYWGVTESDIEIFSKKLVKNYLIGLKWVTYYYFDKCNSWNWYYPYDYPPFLLDIYKYIKDINLNSIIFNMSKPLNPLMQLLCVLPPQSHNLLPESIIAIINNNSDIIYLYPNSFEIDLINKKKHWMGIPMLPHLDIQSIKNFYNKYKHLLTKNEKFINKVQKIFYN